MCAGSSLLFSFVCVLQCKALCELYITGWWVYGFEKRDERTYMHVYRFLELRDGQQQRTSHMFITYFQVWHVCVLCVILPCESVDCCVVCATSEANLFFRSYPSLIDRIGFASIFSALFWTHWERFRMLESFSLSDEQRHLLYLTCIHLKLQQKKTNEMP